jgi:anthranilate phosphoribosyltransferase
MFKSYLEKVLNRENLTRTEASEALEDIIRDETSPTEVGGFLVGLRMKGETEEEIFGFVDTMEKQMVKVRLKDNNAIDVCGTGGDCKHTFNVSTTTALVVAAEGVTVAKHGNRSVSSKTGSADVLQELGVKIDLDANKVKQCVDEIGIGFFFAPLFHPAMKNVAPHRKNLGLRTIFNMLGPLLNPAQVKRQLIGAYDSETAKKLAGVLKLRNYKKACTVHSLDGFDEVSPFSKNDIFEVNSEKKTIRNYQFEKPNGKYGLESIMGDDQKKNAEITLAVLSGEKNAAREMICLNAGFAFYVAGKTQTVEEGIQLAERALDNGSAKQKLNQWVKISNGFN